MSTCYVIIDPTLLHAQGTLKATLADGREAELEQGQATTMSVLIKQHDKYVRIEFLSSKSPSAGAIRMSSSSDEAKAEVKAGRVVLVVEDMSTLA